MRALVTGGTGFVGANLVRHLLRDGHEVHLLERPGSSGWRIEALADRISRHVAPFDEPAALRAALGAARPDWIFHLAAWGGSAWQTDVERIVETNYANTVKLVRAALERGFGAFVHAGSSAEYGRRSQSPAESELPEPDSDYAAAKAAATLYCRYAARRHGARITTLRLYSVFGRFEDPRRLMPALALLGLEGRLPPLADPATARDFVSVDDACDAFVLVADQPVEPGAVYNVGSGRQHTLAEVVAMAREELGIACEPEWASLPPRPWDKTTWVARTDAIRSDLGWAPRRSLAEGFRDLVEWLRSDPARRRHFAELRAASGGPGQKSW